MKFRDLPKRRLTRRGSLYPVRLRCGCDILVTRARMLGGAAICRTHIHPDRTGLWAHSWAIVADLKLRCVHPVPGPMNLTGDDEPVGESTVDLAELLGSDVTRPGDD